MKNHLEVSNTMSSREIAELSGKMHKHVLEAIRKMESAWVDVTGTNFRLSEYTDGSGRKLPEFLLNKKECLYVATKFNDEARAKLILRWEELEETEGSLDFTNPEIVLRLAQNWAAEQKKRAEAEKKIKLLEPKAELMDRIIDSEEKIDVGQAAKILGLPYGRNTLFKKLRESGDFFKARNEPKQEYINKGFFELKEKFIERKNHDGFTVVKVLVTQKGLQYLGKLFEAVNPVMKMAKIR